MAPLVLFFSLAATAAAAATAMEIGQASAVSSDLDPLERDEIIQAVNSAQTTWKAGRNFPNSWTKLHAKRLCGTILQDKNPLPPQPPLPHQSDVTIPKKFDARKKWKDCTALQTIRDQGPCGSCWAVGAVSAFTDRLCIASKGAWNGQLSSNDLLSCCDYCGYGCEGGYSSMAWRFMDVRGVVTGGDYGSGQGCQPYELPACEHHVNSTARQNCSSYGDVPTPQCRKQCDPKYSGPAYDQDKKHLSSYYMISNNETQTKLDILANGPMEASFIVYEDFLNYKSGVYHYVAGKYVGRHAVKVLGWGVEKDTPYWLVANSWNTDWGDKGYFKIKRGTNECSFESSLNAGIPNV